jgi:hypothetical protein
MYSLIWWSLMWRPGKSSIPLVAETNQQLGTSPPDRQTALEGRRQWWQDYGRATPSLRPATTGKVLILIDAEFSP